MELRQLHFFLRVAEELHFGRVAEQEHIVQSAVSEQIRRLEQEIGVRLFVRTSRHVSLTAAGRALVPEVRIGLAQLDRVRSLAQRFGRGERDELVIGFSGLSGSDIVTQMLPPFERQHQGVRVTLRELDQHGISLLLSGSVDIAIGCIEPAGHAHVRTEVIGSESVVAVMRQENPLALRSVLTLEQLTSERRVNWSGFPAIRADLRAVSSEVQDSADCDNEVETVVEMLTTVAAGHGIALAPESVARLYVRPEVVFRQVIGVPATDVLAAWIPETATDIVKSFLRLIPPPVEADEIVRLEEMQKAR